MKEWKTFQDECNRCGSESCEVLSEEPVGFAREDDEAKCTECDLHGVVRVDEWYDEPGAYIVWDEFED